MNLKSPEIKIAVIDLYNNEKNEGIRCIKDILSDLKSRNKNSVKFELFETRFKSEIPDLNYDIFISSGGPGSPFEGEGTVWEKKYFNLLDEVWNFNQKNSDRKKYIFFICHSFQMMCRYFKIAEVRKRRQKSFGILPFIKTAAGEEDPVLGDLPSPFYAADFREYEVVNPNANLINELNAEITAVEIPDNKDEFVSAIMAASITREIVGTQFHPEADPESMFYHLRQPERKQYIIENFGVEKFNEMIKLLDDENAIKLTHRKVLPAFLNNAVEELTPVISS